MSSKAALLPLVLLSVIYIQSTSSQNAWCAILDHQAKHAGDRFWSNLPSRLCSTFVYVIQNIDDIDRVRFNQLSSMNKKSDTDIRLAVRITNDNYEKVTKRAVRLANENFSGFIVIWDEDVTPKTQGKASHVIFKTRVKKLKISQQVTCSPKKPMVKRKLDFREVPGRYYHDYLILAKGTKKDIEFFIDDPRLCYDALGVDTRVVLGLGRITSKSLGYKYNCKDESMKKLLIEVADAINCVSILGAGILWGLSTDDFTGDVCKKKKYPLLDLYGGDTFGEISCSGYSKSTMSRLEVLQPLLLLCAIGVSIFDGRL